MRMRVVGIGVCVIAVVGVGVTLLRWHSSQKNPSVKSVAKGHMAETPATELNNVATVRRQTVPTATGKITVSPPRELEQPTVKTPQVPIALPQDVSEGVRMITGQTNQKDYTVRVAAVHSLGGNLTKADVTGLYAFLKSGLSSHPELDVLSLDALKNDTLQTLIAQETLPSDLLPVILGMYRNSSMDVLWRDYCLQHVVMYYERRWKPDDAKRLDDSDRQEALKMYEEALGTSGNGFAGTALLGLARLSEEYPEIDRAKLAERSLTSAVNEQEDPATRITAVGLCGVLNKVEVLPVARVLAQTGENTPLRLASIGTIGLLGTADDLELMQSLADGSDEAAKKAAQVAVKRITMRKTK